MQYRFHPQRLFLIPLLLVGTLVFAQVAQAQQSRNISIQVGSVFEILIDGTAKNRETSWVLMKNGDFEKADRGSIFQTRPNTVETYTLLGESGTSDSDVSKIEITLSVSDDTATAPVSVTNKPNRPLVRSFRDGNILRLEANRDDISQMLMDLHMEEDTNGDGDPINDNVLTNSFFAKGTGTLYVWIPTVATKQTVLLGARLEDGNVVSQQIELSSDSAIDDIPSIQAVDIDATMVSDDTMQFRAIIPEDAVQNRATISLWEFGDGQQSMLDAPEHTYAEAGNYTVTVTIRDISTSDVLVEESTTVTIRAPAGSDQTDSSTTTPSDDKPKKNKKDSSILGLIIKALLLLIVSVGVGALVIYIFSRFKGSSIQEKLADAEEKHFGPEEDVTTEPPPMEMPEEPVVEAEVIQSDVVEQPTATEVTEDSKEPPPSPDPHPQNEVPSWLAASEPQATLHQSPDGSGAGQAVQTEQEPAPAPPATSEPTPVADPVIDPEPVEREPAPPPAPTPEGSVPDWLQTTPPPPPPTQETEATPLRQDYEGQAEVTKDSLPPPSPNPDPHPTNELSKEEREREKKRKKRQRYRQNKKAREQETKSEAPQETSPAEDPKAVPDWLQASPPPPAPAPEPSASQQENDDDVKFVISADSVEDQTPPPPIGEIDEEKKEE